VLVVWAGEVRLQVGEPARWRQVLSREALAQGLEEQARGLEVLVLGQVVLVLGSVIALIFALPIK
jgi:hypothetical protein